MARSRSRKTEARPPGPRCRVAWELDRGLVMMPWLFVSGRPWDAPGAWTADALVTFEGGGGRLRTDGMEIRVIQEPGESRLAVRQKVESVIRRMDAVEAVVTHLRPPMSLEMIRFIQLYNTDLAREQRSRRSLQSR